MAERTGISALDEALRSFAQSTLTLDDESGSRTICASALAGAAEAAGRCEQVALRCAEFLRQAGFDAAAAISDELNLPTADQLGYRSRSCRGHERHCLTYVSAGGHRFAIDFTASQYGYREFPLVQRQDRTSSEWLMNFADPEHGEQPNQADLSSSHA